MMNQKAAVKWRDAALLYVDYYLRDMGAETDENGNWIFPRMEQHDGCVYTLHEALCIVEEADNNIIMEARTLEFTQDVFHQASKHTGKIKRVPEGETPVVDLYLREDQYVVSLQLDKLENWTNPDRKTHDWAWTAYVVTPLK